MFFLHVQVVIRDQNMIVKIMETINRFVSGHFLGRFGFTNDKNPPEKIKNDLEI